MDRKTYAGQKLLPIGPFREWINSYVPLYYKEVIFADLTGIHFEELRKIRNNSKFKSTSTKKWSTRKRIGIDKVDRAMCAVGDHLMDIYPELYE